MKNSDIASSALHNALGDVRDPWGSFSLTDACWRINSRATCSYNVIRSLQVTELTLPDNFSIQLNRHIAQVQPAARDYLQEYILDTSKLFLSTYPLSESDELLSSGLILPVHNDTWPANHIL